MFIALICQSRPWSHFLMLGNCSLANIAKDPRPYSNDTGVVDEH